ncbi:phage major capsid protein [Tuanshanicoccus lijuaniae]|nr:phage major capsid protein [Aerococcaceae bacterium zg-1292]
MTTEERNALEAVRSEKRADQFNTVTSNANVIPTEMLNEVVRKARKQGGLIQQARAFNVPANLKVPVGTPLTKAEWHTEGTKVNAEKTTETVVEFLSNELIKIISLSAKFKRMSLPAFETYLVDELVASVMEAIEHSLIHGTGSGQGKGLETIEWTKNTNHIEYKKNTTPAYTDFTKLVSMLKRGYSKSAKFAMNNATLFGKVYGVVDGNNRPIFIQDTQADSIGKILGFEVVIDDNISDGVIYFGNYQFLGYNLPEGIVLEVSRESSFNLGLIDYRALAIADTQVILPEAFVKLSEAQV